MMFMWKKFGLKLQINCEIRTLRGSEGGGGVKEAEGLIFCRCPFYNSLIYVIDCMVEIYKFLILT